MKQLLIDADFTLFQACSAVEREAVFTNEAGSPVHILNSCADEAMATFRRSVEGYISALYATEAVLVLSGRKVLHMLTAKDLEDDASAMERDALKLRNATA